MGSVGTQLGTVGVSGINTIAQPISIQIMLSFICLFIIRNLLANVNPVELPRKLRLYTMRGLVEPMRTQWQSPCIPQLFERIYGFFAESTWAFLGFVWVVLSV